MEAIKESLGWLAQRTENAERFLSGAGDLWCRLMHDDITWPRHGQYRCRRCNLVHSVPWEATVSTSPSQPRPAAWQHVAA